LGCLFSGGNSQEEILLIPWTSLEKKAGMVDEKMRGESWETLMHSPYLVIVHRRREAWQSKTAGILVRKGCAVKKGKVKYKPEGV